MHRKVSNISDEIAENVHSVAEVPTKVRSPYDFVLQKTTKHKNTCVWSKTSFLHGFSLLFRLLDTLGRAGLRSGPAGARPGPGILSFIIYPSLLSAGPGPVFYLSSPYTHHSYWQVFYLSSPYTHHSYWPVFYLPSLYTHHSTIPKNGRVVFLAKIKKICCLQET